MISKKIDLNCDMGEAFGAWSMGNDTALMELISSANIACGFHAGDATIMRKTAQLALEKKVAIGAHPAFPDLQGFGRRSMQLSPQEVYDICVYQIGAMFGTIRALGGKLHHVKPHGALYNMAAKDANLAKSIARATKAIHPDLILYGLSGSHLITEAEKIGLRTASEVFADRTYQNDGNLTPRTQANAMIESTQDAVNQVIMMIEKQCIISTEGIEVPLKADTICIHGDGNHAVEFAEELRNALLNKNISIETIK
ncbi:MULTISPECIES: LamB/YcsF family protein [Emticicia]|uniref:LamB/YcsF family protein n=1 Tax=Emticicia TaxID=312278 RepID=UPI0007D898CD|nr:MULTISPECIES: 5-oxoprolinase subunit PxpA [Emticicia]